MNRKLLMSLLVVSVLLFSGIGAAAQSFGPAAPQTPLGTGPTYQGQPSAPSPVERASDASGPPLRLFRQPALDTSIPPASDHVPAPLAAQTNPAVTLGEWKTYNTANSAIPYNVISAVAVDTTGNVWAGTQGQGLGMLNGGAWSTIKSPSLINDWVMALTVDTRNRLWVAAPTLSSTVTGGVAVYTGTWSHPLTSTYVSSLAAVGNEIWIGTANSGIYRYDASANPPAPLPAFTVASTVGGLASDRIAAITVAYYDDAFCGRAPWVWVAHDAGASEYRYGVVDIRPIRCGWSWFNYSPALGHPLPATPITAIAVDTRNRIWFGSDDCLSDRLTVLDGTTWITYTVNNSALTYNSVETLASDPQGRVWIGAWTICPNLATRKARMEPDAASPQAPAFPLKFALNVFDNGTWCYYEEGGGTCQLPSPPAGLPSVYVKALLTTQERLWIGTDFGLATLTLNWKTLNTSNTPLTSNRAQAVWLDAAPGATWIGGPGGVDRFDGSNWQHYATTSAGASQGIVALHRDDAGRLWAGEPLNGTVSGSSVVWLYQPVSDMWTPYAVPGPGRVASLASDQTANYRLWLATSSGAKVFNVATSSWVTLSASNAPLPSDVVNAVSHDRAGRMWLGTQRGIAVYTGTGWLTYTAASTGGGLISDTVQALAADGLGRVWVGTAGGASMISGTTWTTYTVASTGGGLMDNRILSIAVDRADRVWFGTAWGASLFDGAHWTWFNHNNSGLADGYGLLPRSLAADASGGTWFGTTSGVSVRGVLTGPVGYPPPSITSFSPASGEVNALVTIQGTNFYFGSA